MQLGAPDNPTLFPYHYLSVVLQRIGGQIALVEHDGDPSGRRLPLSALSSRDGFKAGDAYTLRYHRIFERDRIDLDAGRHDLHHAGRQRNRRLYDPTVPQEYAPTYARYGDLDIGRPIRGRPRVVRALQQQIWGSRIRISLSDRHAQCGLRPGHLTDRAG